MMELLHDGEGSKKVGIVSYLAAEKRLLFDMTWFEYRLNKQQMRNPRSLFKDSEGLEVMAMGARDGLLAAVFSNGRAPEQIVLMRVPMGGRRSIVFQGELDFAARFVHFDAECRKLLVAGRYRIVCFDTASYPAAPDPRLPGS